MTTNELQTQMSRIYQEAGMVKLDLATAGIDLESLLDFTLLNDSDIKTQQAFHFSTPSTSTTTTQRDSFVTNELLNINDNYHVAANDTKSINNINNNENQNEFKSIVEEDIFSLNVNDFIALNEFASDDNLSTFNIDDFDLNSILNDVQPLDEQLNDNMAESILALPVASDLKFHASNELLCPVANNLFEQEILFDSSLLASNKKETSLVLETSSISSISSPSTNHQLAFQDESSTQSFASLLSSTSSSYSAFENVLKLANVSRSEKSHKLKRLDNKKESNKAAALRYRNKKLKEREELFRECEAYAKRNEEKKKKIEDLQTEISFIKSLLVEALIRRNNLNK